jgi:hypothetical protein
MIKIKNSGNQPEFQSSIKKRTVNQTVVWGKIPSYKFQIPIRLEFGILNIEI